MKEGWKEVRLGDLCEIIRGKRFVRKDIVSEGVPCIHYGDIYTYYGLYTFKSKGYITPELAKKMRLAYKNDVVVVQAGENPDDIGVGVAWLGAEPAAVHDACFILRHKQNPLYLSYFLRTKKYHNYLKGYVHEGKICSFLKPALENAILPLPPLPEQQRIVAVLDSVFASIEQMKQNARTNLINAQAVLKNALDELMQIKEGWEEVKLGEVCNFINGRAYSKSELLDKGKYRVLRVGNFFTNNSWYYSDLELEEDKYCYNGDLLYAWSTSFGPKIWDGEKTIFHYHIWNVKFDTNKLIKKFLYYFFDWDKQSLSESKTGTTMVHVSMSNMVLRKIPLPPLPEQQRIVAILDDLSERCKRLERNYRRIINDCEEMKQAILKKLIIDN